MATSDLVYEYSGAELGAPGPAWTELLTDSLKSAFDQVDTDIAAIPTLADSGWVLISTFGAGWAATAGNPARIRRVGDRVDISGSITRTALASVADMFTVPVGFRQAGAYTQAMVGATVTSGATAHMLYLTTAHKITIPNGYGPAVPSGVFVPVVGTWYVD